MPPVNLKAFMKPSRVVKGLYDAPQRDILSQLAKPLFEDGVILDAEQFIDDLERREAEITTVMDNGVAFPHARSNAVKTLGLVVGLADENGIHSIPGSDVRSRLFFCIAVPAFLPTAHIGMLQALAKFARDQHRVEKILSSKTAAVASRYLASYKG